MFLEITNDSWNKNVTPGMDDKFGETSRKKRKKEKGGKQERKGF